MSIVRCNKAILRRVQFTRLVSFEPLNQFNWKLPILIFFSAFIGSEKQSPKRRTHAQLQNEKSRNKGIILVIF